MRVLFAGSAAFAVPALAALLAQGHRVPLVLTKPDRAAGRGMKINSTPIKGYAHQHGLRILEPTCLGAPELQREIATLVPDVMVVVAYGLLIPATLLGLPRHGCLNIHASLLPRWRGAAPVEHALLAGDHQSGVTIMQMDPGLDTGDVLWQRAVAIEQDDTAGSLRAKLAELGAQGMLSTLESVARGALLAQPQCSTGITYASKIDKKDARLNWSRPAAELARKVRAFNPAPTARGMLDGAPLLVWKAAAVEASGSPGTIIDVSPTGILVACGEGALRIEELQKPGGRKMTVVQFLVGHRLCEGKIFD